MRKNVKFMKKIEEADLDHRHTHISINFAGTPVNFLDRYCVKIREYFVDRRDAPRAQIFIGV